MTAINKTDIYRAIIAQIVTLRGTKVKFAGFTDQSYLRSLTSQLKKCTDLDISIHSSTGMGFNDSIDMDYIYIENQRVNFIHPEIRSEKSDELNSDLLYAYSVDQSRRCIRPLYHCFKPDPKIRAMHLLYDYFLLKEDVYASDLNESFKDNLIEEVACRRYEPNREGFNPSHLFLLDMINGGFIPNLKAEPRRGDSFTYLDINEYTYFYSYRDDVIWINDSNDRRPFCDNFVIRFKVPTYYLMDNYALSLITDLFELNFDKKEDVQE